MYALLLICAMAIGQEAAEEATAPAEKNVSSFQLAKEHLKALESISKELDLRGGIDIQKHEDGKTVTISGERTKVIRLRNAFELRGMWQAPKDEVRKKFTRRIPIVSEKRDTVADAIKVLNVENCQFGFLNENNQHILHLEASTEEELDSVEATLEKLGLAIPIPSVKVLSLKHLSSEVMKNTLEFRGIGRAKIVIDGQLNRLIVTGTKSELKQIEAMVAQFDQPQDSANSAKTDGSTSQKPESENVVKLSVPREQEGQLTKLLDQLKNPRLKITYPDVEGDINVEGPASEIQKLQRDLKLTAREMRVFELKNADVTSIAQTLNQLKMPNVTIVAEAKTNSVIATGSSGDINIVEALLSNLDIMSENNQSKSDNSLTKIEESDFQLVESRAQEWRALVKRYTDLKLKYDFHTATNTLNVKGPYNEITFIEMVLDEQRLLRNKVQVKVAPLKNSLASELAKTLTVVAPKKLKITPEPASNSLILNGYPEDIKEAEFLIAEFDVKRSEKTTKSAANPSKDARQYVYRLVYAPAAEVAESINRLEIDGVSVTTDERTNSLVILAEKKELKIVIGIIQAFDKKHFDSEEAKQTAPNPVIGTLWSDFAKAEAKSIATAGEMRTAAAKFGNEHPTMVELRTRLETEVKIAFELRHKLQQAEAAELRRQLTEIEARLTKREKNKAAIIKARVNSLINMDDLGWEAMTKPKPSNTEAIAAKTGNPSRDSSTESIPFKPQTDVALAEAWERVDRDEYIHVKTLPNGGFGGVANTPPMAPQYLHGVLIGGNAMIREHFGWQNEQVVWVGEKQLPCRLAAVGPFSIHAFRSSRFPSQGITDFTHESKEGKQVWAFVPNQQETLVKAKVFRKSGPEFAIDEETSFGIEAEGKIETGYLVCNDQGEFLGIVSYHNGSLGACWSAIAIGDWLERTNMEAPEPNDPLKGRVIVALPGSAYLPIATEAKGGIGGGFESPRPGRAFYGAIIKGVIVTHPEVCKSELQTSGKILYGGKTLTFEKMKLSEDGRFSLIWCKELTAKDGFASAHQMVHGKEFAIPLGTRAQDVRIYGGKMGSVEVVQPTQDEIGSFETARHNRSVVRNADDKGFDIEWLGNFNSVGLPVVTTGGHFLGVVDSDNPGSLKTSQEFQAARQHHTVHALSAEEILRLVDEESKKIASGAEPAKSATTTTPLNSKPNVEPEVARREAAEAFNERIKEPEAAIVVSAEHVEAGQTQTTRTLWRGSIVNGCIILAGLLQENELVQVGNKQLPQRQIGITPGGLYVYHRQRLPQGYTKPASDPVEGDRVWLVAPLGGGRNAVVGAQIISPNENTKDLPIVGGREFLLESDGSVTPGTTVLSDGGLFLGIVKRNKGSLAICETANSILLSLQRMFKTPPDHGNPNSATFWFHDHKAGKHWKGLIVRGVLVADPSLLEEDFSKLEIGGGGQMGDKLTKSHSVKILGDRLALIWCEEIKPGYGISDHRSVIAKDDFAFTDMQSRSDARFTLERDQRVRSSGYNGGHAFATRVTEVRDKEFDLDWYKDNAQIGVPVFDPGWHLLGFNVAKSAEERASLKSPRASSVVLASEVFRAIEEESKKLPPTATPEINTEINTEKPAEKPPESPKTESPTPEPPK